MYTASIHDNCARVCFHEDDSGMDGTWMYLVIGET